MITLCRVEGISGDDYHALGSPSLENFVHFIRYSSQRTELFLLRGERDGRTVGLAPVVRLARRPSTDALRPAVRRWLAPWLGVLSRKTTYLLDTAFLAYEYRDPFIVADPGDRAEFRQAVLEHLQHLPDADSIWLTVPAQPSGEATSSPDGPPTDLWSRDLGFYNFSMIPMAHVVWSGLGSWDPFLATQSKKRRRNVRQDHDAFTQGAGRLELKPFPFSSTELDAMQFCLRSSEKKSSINVPYNDVLLGNGFRTQPQFAWLAWVGDHLAGFASFIRNGEQLLQCHGGFDYARSLSIRAYPHLLNQAISYGMEIGCTSLSLGPLNNEAKRRAATCLLPLRVHLWNRRRTDALVVSHWFARNFQVYEGA